MDCYICGERIENGDWIARIELNRAAYAGERFGWDLERPKEVPIHGWCL